ncbi:hypothetical protein KUL73_13415 [Rhodospirillum rubrum]|nr:hypothetical protein KUL73_13415 [Rhodospirillum rubrum]
MSVDLTAAIVAVTGEDPRVLVVARPGRDDDSFPSGPLRDSHRTLQAGLRAWVERQTGRTLGHVEQLYAFGDRDRVLPASSGSGEGGGGRVLSLAYLALVREAGDGPAEWPGARWRGWYDFLPWEDRRAARPTDRSILADRLAAWARRAADPAARRARVDRVGLLFGLEGRPWDEEAVLERYEALFEARLVPEAWRGAPVPVPEAVSELGGRPMAGDHRRILASALGRLRTTIKYRPVLFELMAPHFTLLQLQRTAEALSGARLHKQNFRRLVEQQGLVEETGEVFAETGGRPAKLMRFRSEIRRERPSVGLRMRARPED